MRLTPLSLHLITERRTQKIKRSAFYSSFSSSSIQKSVWMGDDLILGFASWAFTSNLTVCSLLEVCAYPLRDVSRCAKPWQDAWRLMTAHKTTCSSPVCGESSTLSQAGVVKYHTCQTNRDWALLRIQNAFANRSFRPFSLRCDGEEERRFPGRFWGRLQRPIPPE